MHAALKLRNDVLGHKLYAAANVGKEGAYECAHKSLYVLLKVLYGGQEVLDRDTEADDEEDKVDCTDSVSDISCKIFSVAQYLVYGMSGEETVNA